MVQTQLQLSTLNPAQCAAVTSDKKTTLVVAGAGSGKTRVLTHRIAFLIQHNTPAHAIMAVTFTNKAAKEMRVRLESMLGMGLSNNMWLGTFHGLAHRFLRLHWHEAGLSQNFQILDADDQRHLLKRVHKDLQLSEEKWPVKQSLAFINHCKNSGMRSTHLHSNAYNDQMLKKIYEHYEKACNTGNLVDFSELLLRSYELWQQHPTLRTHYQQRFQHVLIDEFQDTNSIQYLWMKCLTDPVKTSLMVVGDDDQSIYSWRGAAVENMQLLLNDFPDTEVIRLEQNYRSTSNILQAANAVIANNTKRLGKNLWTASGDGEPINIYTAYNDIEEAKYVVNKINDIKNKLGAQSLSNVAILYRSNAQSRLFEEQLLYMRIPYRIYGGLRFFERAEIKDAMAYLRLAANVDDDASLDRIINLPPRGIGDVAMIKVRECAQQNKISLFAAIQKLLSTGELSARASKALASFAELVTNLVAQVENLALDELVSFAIEISGLREHFAKDNNERNLMRIDNLDELINAAKQFNAGTPNFGAGTAGEGTQSFAKEMLNSFLAHASLEAGESVYNNDENGDGSDCADHFVQLMTLHSAKGLEFDTVFLCGLEEGLFPHASAIGATSELEEERRLCYVGITRARANLYCTLAEKRQRHGSICTCWPSRFLSEIPPELIREDKAVVARPLMYSGTMMDSRQNYNVGYMGSTAGAAKNTTLSVGSSSVTVQSSGVGPASLQVGQKIRHVKFGEGVVVDYEGAGEHLLLQVRFNRHGLKWLSPAYAKLEPVA